MQVLIDSKMLWRQFAIAIDSLGEALRQCPDALWELHLWEDVPDQWVAMGFSSFWYLVYHTLFWLDLYLTGAEEGFRPPEPFDLVEMEAHETLPRPYTREKLLGYWALCRQRCQEAIESLTVDRANEVCTFAWGEVPYGELLLYTMRHVEEHASQLHMFLGQHRE